MVFFTGISGRAKSVSEACMKPAGSGSKHFCFWREGISCSYTGTTCSDHIKVPNDKGHLRSRMGDSHKSRQAFRCVWCGVVVAFLPGLIMYACVGGVGRGDGKTSVSPSLLVVHSSYHHDCAPDGAVAAGHPPLTHGSPSVCGFQT